ncbi:MAG: hypothetical protein ACK5LV_04895 [Lachnospirales bacterium]
MGNESKGFLKIKKDATPYLMLAPILIFVSCFLLWPMINVFIMSIQEYELLKPGDRHFIGLANYIAIFTEDDIFFKALGNLAKYRMRL